LRPDAVRNFAHALFIEGFGTSVLVFCMFCLTHRRNPVPGSAVPALVGVAYGLLVATLGPLTGYEKLLVIDCLALLVLLLLLLRLLLL
jgi:glycerol uptake facilitator-like aquaporin